MLYFDSNWDEIEREKKINDEQSLLETFLIVFQGVLFDLNDPEKTKRIFEVSF